MARRRTPVAHRIDDLRQRFEENAYQFPQVDAVVVYRPDLRREWTERQARERFKAGIEPTSQRVNSEVLRQTTAAYKALGFSVHCESWVPPGDKSIEELGLRSYWTRILDSAESPDAINVPADAEVWSCTLFGPPASNEAMEMRRFNLLAEEAARLILAPSKAQGTGLVSRWLIHLADREEPVQPDCRRRYLAWPSVGKRPGAPIWVPCTPQNPTSVWWAARLVNVFRVSGLATEQVRRTPEADDQTVPFTSPLGASDLARLLRERGYDRATNKAVASFLYRLMGRMPDCFVPIDRDDRRRNQHSLLFRPEVWALLVQHFARSRS